MVGSPFDSMHVDDCAFVLIPDYQCSSVVDGIDIKFRCFSTPTGSFNPFSSSCTVLETNAPEENTFQITPNPAADYLDIQVSDNNTSLQAISLTDLSGKKLRNWESVEAHYSLQGLPAGIYFVEVIFGNGMRTVKQLVKL